MSDGKRIQRSERITEDDTKIQIKETTNIWENEKRFADKKASLEINTQQQSSGDSNGLLNTCSNCRKAFKTLNSYTRHRKEQKCVDFLVRTYCVLCDTTFDTRNDYEVHMMSGDHMAKINKNSFKNIINLNESNDKKTLNNINKQNIVDPYLSAKESLSMIDSDNKFTIVYKDGRVEDKVMRVDRKKDKKNVNVGIDESKNKEYNSEVRTDALSPISSVSSTEEDDQSRYEKELVSGKDDDEVSIKEKEENGVLRRKKIMIVLKNMQNDDKSVIKFLKILNKLNLEDYKGLNNDIIRDKNITVLPKQKYLKAIKDFVGLLIKKKSEGYNAHNGNDIQQIVANLMC